MCGRVFYFKTQDIGHRTQDLKTKVRIGNIKYGDYLKVQESQ